MFDAIMACVLMTALGEPVEPDVNSSFAIVSAPTLCSARRRVLAPTGSNAAPYAGLMKLAVDLIIDDQNNRDETAVADDFVLRRSTVPNSAST